MLLLACKASLDVVILDKQSSWVLNSNALGTWHNQGVFWIATMECISAFL